MRDLEQLIMPLCTNVLGVEILGQGLCIYIPASMSMQERQDVLAKTSLCLSMVVPCANWSVKLIEIER